MSNRSVTYTLNLNSNVITALNHHEQAALRLDGTMQQLNSTIENIGIGIAIKKTAELVKEVVHGASEMEVALLRIKNVSNSTYQGLLNKTFIRDEVNKFKIDLFEATDAYGEFLTMVRGSGLASSEIRKLHDEVLTIGKVTGISNGQMDASVRNIGKLLEQGTLESKHLRPLTYQLSGLMPYIAKELGVTNQQLEKSLSSGALTRSAIDSRILLSAIENYSKDLEPKLTESLQTIESSVNSAKNEWLDFKNSLVFQMKPELQSLLSSLTNTVHWLNQHKDAVKRVVETLGYAIKIYVSWRALMLSVNLINGAFLSTTVLRTNSILAQSAATTSLNGQIGLLNINLETLIALQTAAAVSAGNMLTAQQAVNLAMYNQLGLTSMTPGMGLGLAGAANNSAINSLKSSISAALTGTVLAVGISWLSLEALEGLNNALGGNKNTGDEGYKFSWTDMFKDPTFEKAKRAGASQANHDFLQGIINEKYLKKGTLFPADGENIYDLIKLAQQSINKGSNPYKFDLIKSLIGYDKYGNLLPHKNEDLWEKMIGLGYNLGKNLWLDPKKANDGHGGKELNKDIESLELGTSRIRGNSSNYITINTGDLIGMENPIFTVKNQSDMQDISKEVGVQLTKILTDVINDSQLIGQRR